MNYIISGILLSITNVISYTGSNACVFLWVDEPICPKKLIKM